MLGETSGEAQTQPINLYSHDKRLLLLQIHVSVCNYDHLDFPQPRLNTWPLMEPVLDSGHGKSQASRPLYIYWYSNTHSVTHPRLACFIMSKELMNECFCNIKHSSVCLGKSQKSFAWSHFKCSWRCIKDLRWKWSSARNVSKAAAQTLNFSWCRKCTFYIFKWWESAIPLRNRQRAEACRLLLDILLTSCPREWTEICPIELRLLLKQSRIYSTRTSWWGLITT